jgi:MFS family permease
MCYIRETPLRLPRPDPKRHAGVPPQTFTILHPDSNNSLAYRPWLVLPRLRTSHRAFRRQTSRQEEPAIDIPGRMHRGDSAHRLHAVRYDPPPSVVLIVESDNMHAVSTLFIGRIIQAISGSATWVASFAMLVETVEPERRGQTLALAMSVITCGTVTGPAIAGAVFQLASYWAAWSVPLVLLGIDAAARLAMVESASGKSTPDNIDRQETPEPQESDSLLRTPADDYETTDQNQSKTAETQITIRSSSNSIRDPWSDELTSLPTPGFYRTMLFNPGILAGLANTLGQSVIVAGFDTTLPLFLRNTFGWGSMPIGLIFIGLQGPIIILGPVVGGIRDRLGCRIPTVLGWAIVAPFLMLLALVGRPELARAASGFGGEVLVVVCVAGVGIGFLLTRGGGAFQTFGVTVSPSSLLHRPFADFDLAVTKELEDGDPNLFDPNGGNSKVCALLEMAFNVGMLLGPLISGSLLETLGYFYLNCFMCESLPLPKVN